MIPWLLKYFITSLPSLLKLCLASALWSIFDYVRLQHQFYTILHWRNAQRQSGTRDWAQRGGERGIAQIRERKHKLHFNPSRLSDKDWSQTYVTKLMIYNHLGRRRKVKWKTCYCASPPPRSWYGPLRREPLFDPPPLSQFWSRWTDSVRIFMFYESRKSHALAAAAVRRLTRVFRLNQRSVCVWEARADSRARSADRSNGAPVPCCNRTNTTMTAPKIRWNTENWWFSGECFAFTTDSRLPSLEWINYRLPIWPIMPIIGLKRISITFTLNSSL